MKFICDKTTLNETIEIVQKAASPKSTQPALEGILIEVRADQTVHFSAYDTSVAIYYDIKAEDCEPGKVVLNSHLFGDIARKLPSGEVIIETKKESFLTSIKSGNSFYNITGLDPESFPELPGTEGGDGVTLTCADFKTLIRQTIYAVAIDNLNVMLTGVLFELDEEDGFLRAVGADNFRLAIRKAPFQQKNGNFHSVVIPGRVLNEMMKILPEDKEEIIEVSLNKNFVIFRYQNVVVVSRLLEGSYLDYKPALPKTKKFSLKVNVRDFYQMIERASLMAKGTFLNPIRCDLDYDQIKISTASEVGNFNDSIPVEPFSEKMVIGFNFKYMLAALGASGEDEIIMELVSTFSPIVLRPLEGDDFYFLVLPLRMKDQAE